MGQPIQLVEQGETEPDRRADKALLLTRISPGLPHDGKNRLHNMVLHLQLLAEKLGSSPVEKHLSALRDGILRIDRLLEAFDELVAPDNLPPDLVAAAQRAVRLLAYDARRAGVEVSLHAPGALLVQSDSSYLGDLVAHVLAACIDCRGQVGLRVEAHGATAVLEARAEGGARERALPHLEAARRQAAGAACELSIEFPAQGGLRLSLSFLHPAQPPWRES